MLFAIYPPSLPKPVRLFAHSHSQKPVRFPAGQNECVHHATPSFYPPDVAAGITHYTFVPKVVCQRVPLWKPYFVGVCSHTSSKMQNKRHRPARSRCCSIPLICLHGLLILSPILTVLFYHFCMHRGLADAEFPRRRTHRCPVFYQVKGQLTGPLLHVPFDSAPLLSHTMHHHYMPGFPAAEHRLFPCHGNHFLV